MKILMAGLRLITVSIVSLLFLILSLIFWVLSGFHTAVSRFFVRYWASLMLWVLNVKVTVSGQIPSKRVILMPNHRGYLDIFIILARFPESIVAKKELGKWPVIGQAVKIARLILVDRTNMKSMLETMRKINAEILSGGSIILFPEGTTFKGPLTKSFKPGSFKIAAETKTPVIPAAINFHDPEDAWVGDNYFILHFFRQMGKWTTYADLWFGEPILEPDYHKCLELTQQAIDHQLQILNGLVTQ